MAPPLFEELASKQKFLDPWSRARRCPVHEATASWWTYLVSQYGRVVDDADIQLARIVAAIH